MSEDLTEALRTKLTWDPIGPMIKPQRPQQWVYIEDYKEEDWW